ncbi:hypothetical protein [Wolbachia endosymbiont of Pentidionis agamae]|uniref:hypothetical protein n=1 Tax=Wolbachia endosymbiont of Pentidionis agamae TaxID=3110435 RepID=UPI002FD5A6FB
MGNKVLVRYALAYIKKSKVSDPNKIRNFLSHIDAYNSDVLHSWSAENFDRIYGAFKGSNNQQRNQSYTSFNNNTNQQRTVHENVNIIINENRGLDFWDLILLQCCINSLYSKSNNVTNNTNINYSHNQAQNSQKKEQEDRKLLALGVLVVTLAIIFHASICFFYMSSRKNARKSDDINYLDKKLKLLSGTEFTCCALSLAALVGCAIYPVLPVWGLVILGINSLVCFFGGLAFYNKHEKESGYIEKAREAASSFNGNSGYNNGFNHHQENQSHSSHAESNCYNFDRMSPNGPLPSYDDSMRGGGGNSTQPTAPPASQFYEAHINHYQENKVYTQDC